MHTHLDAQKAPHNTSAKSVIPVFSQIGRMVEEPDAVTEILNNHDVLRAVIHCIEEEKMAVAKQVRNKALKSSAWDLIDSIVCALIVLCFRPFSLSLNWVTPNLV